jgi:hypothetical protein
VTNLLKWPMRLLSRMPFLIGTMVIVGAFLGGAVVPAVHGLIEAFDAANPVLVVRARVVSVSTEDVVVSLAGEKRRDCQYIGLQAYTRQRGIDALTDAYIRRLDIPETGVTRPIGSFRSFGEWRIWPRGNASVVLVYANHGCSGRLVISKVAEIQLPGG